MSCSRVTSGHAYGRLSRNRLRQAARLAGLVPLAQAVAGNEVSRALPAACHVHLIQRSTRRLVPARSRGFPEGFLAQHGSHRRRAGELGSTASLRGRQRGWLQLVGQLRYRMLRRELEGNGEASLIARLPAVAGNQVLLALSAPRHVDPEYRLVRRVVPSGGLSFFDGFLAEHRRRRRRTIELSSSAPLRDLHGAGLQFVCEARWPEFRRTWRSTGAAFLLPAIARRQVGLLLSASRNDHCIFGTAWDIGPACGRAL